jgi:predicted nuclease of predicted toxin-antitoxin system
VRFLIDECLHSSLTDIAHRAGFEAHHVNWRGRGWSGWDDRQLSELAVREGFVLVTNNARDFLKLMGEVELHAGLVVIVPNVAPTVQCEMFQQDLKRNRSASRPDQPGG